MHATVGCHPTYTSDIDSYKEGTEEYKQALEAVIREELDKGGESRLVAIGEIGLGESVLRLAPPKLILIQSVVLKQTTTVCTTLPPRRRPNTFPISSHSRRNSTYRCSCIRGTQTLIPTWSQLSEMPVGRKARTSRKGEREWYIASREVGKRWKSS